LIALGWRKVVGKHILNKLEILLDFIQTRQCIDAVGFLHIEHIISRKASMLSKLESSHPILSDLGINHISKNDFLNILPF
jgi:hypothetical protein